MSKNQLFKIIPDEKIILSLLNAYNLKTILNKGINKKINDLKLEITKYYIKCKSKIYLSTLNEKKCITILRQFLKTQNYNIISKEKTKNKIKFSIYRIIQDKNKILSHKKQETRKIILDFST